MRILKNLKTQTMRLFRLKRYAYLTGGVVAMVFLFFAVEIFLTEERNYTDGVKSSSAQLLGESTQTDFAQTGQDNVSDNSYNEARGLFGGLTDKIDEFWTRLAVLEYKLKNLSTRDIRIKDDSISKDDIRDGAVTSSKIHNNTIEEKDIKDGAISDQRLIVDELITSLKIKDGTLTNEDISPDTKISSSKLDLTDFTMANIPTDDEKTKVGELVDSGDGDIDLGDKNTNQIHDQNTDTATDSQSFTIGATGNDIGLVFGSSDRALTFDHINDTFTFNQPLSMLGEKLTHLSNPTDDQDAATKNYVDSQLSTEISSLKWQDPVDTLSSLATCGNENDGEARLVTDENWIYRCNDADDTWYKVANVATVNHNALQNRTATDSHPSEAISFSPYGSISSTNSQDALEELESEVFKLSVSSDQTIVYGSDTTQTILKMDPAQSQEPFKIATSSDADRFVVNQNGIITTASINSSSIVNNSITGSDLATDITVATTGSLSGSTLISTVANGTAPLTVTSLTKVSNLNVDLLDGFNSSQIGGINNILVTDASGNLTLTNGKINLESMKFEPENSAPATEEGKAYYDNNDKTFKVYNGQTNEYTDLVADPKIQPSWCPDGYISVPGDARYGTEGGFCVMKYEAKCAATTDLTTGLTVPDTTYQTYANNTTACTAVNTKAVVSVPTGYAIANISQTTAKTYCETLGTGYKLITNNQWMTLARNIEKQPSNWTGGAVGVGGIWRGHSDNTIEGGATNKGLSADPSGDDGYYQTGNTSPSIEKRTFVLSNGETVWDLSGNTYEWTQDTIRRKDQPHSTTTPDNTFGWKELNTIDDYGMMSYANMRPSNPAWTATQNMGRIYTYNPSGDTDNTRYAFRRGGCWNDGSYTGLFTLNLNGTPSNTSNNIGFRCVFQGL